MTSTMKKHIFNKMDCGSKLSLLFIVICLVSTDLTEASIVDHMPSVVARMWDLVAGRNAIVQAVDLDLFFNRYDPLQPDLLNLYEEEFIGGEVSWTQDFVLQQMTVEYSKAYFRSTDVYLEANIAPYLNFEDMDVLINICEHHAGTGILGYVNEAMFNAGFVEVIYRGVPFSLLFVRYNTYDEEAQRYESLNNTEFQILFHEIDTDDDLLVSKNEMAEFWESGNYGNKDTGKLLFDKINYMNSSHIDLAAWTELQLALDCRDDNLKIDFEEMLQLDLIINDLLTYPGGDCTLDRYVR